MEHGATADGLPASNRQAVQKARERAHLQRFRDNFAGFPEGEVVSSESPDFLVKSQPRWIGIELTEYHVQEPDEGWGSPMRAQEGPEDKVLRTASAQYQSKGLPAVAVHVHWNSHQVFSSRQGTVARRRSGRPGEGESPRAGPRSRNSSPSSCVALLATGGGIAKNRSPDKSLKELMDVRARGVRAYSHSPRTPEDNAGQRS